MPGLAVNVAVIHENKILLTKREDFETWILPSGGVEDDESIAQAAIRETKEETGLDVELTRLVGVYSRLSNMSPGYMILFAAKPIGGEIKCQPGETIAVEWFSFDQIPSPLSAGHKRRIEDAISGVTGITVLQEFNLPAMPEKITRDELIELRDKSGLSRQDFYLQMFKYAKVKETVEVSGDRKSPFLEQMKITPCGTEHFEELVSFVVRLNGDDTHHIGFFGEGEADVRSSLAECVIPPAEGFQLAYDGNQLVGVFGVDADPEIGRAWLFGPLIEHADWQSLADELYAASIKVIPEGISEQDLFCDVRNSNMADFAERHGFPLHSENAVVTLERVDYKKPAPHESPFSIIDYSPSFFEQFESCHNLLFPTTYFTARQIVEKLDSTRRMFLGLEDGKMKGYHFCKVESEARSGYIDFIGVDESVRGRGLGATLLAAGIDWMLSFPETDKINLTVNANNVTALKLYKNFGFVTERIMRGYRKKGINV